MTKSLNRDVELFTEAVQLPMADRAAFLDRVCNHEPELREEVLELLKVHDSAGNFLQRSPLGAAAEIGRESSIGVKIGDRIGRYRLLRPIGEGGCGVVYLAEQEEPVRRPVALKVIKPGMDTKSVIARFEAERQALALMDHPNIAKVLDAGATESGRPYFVMELVQGVKITEYCDQNSLSTRERLKLFIQVCHAIQHAHQKGIIHRDIKPSNILVTTGLESQGLPVVIDFGIAKATTNQQLTDKTFFTAFELLVGTPAYMSPEQAELTKIDLDTRTDIYSLGVLLYELLTGSTPFDMDALSKSGLDEIRRVIREQEPFRPSTRLEKLPRANLIVIAKRHRSESPSLIRTIRGDLDWIVMKALEKDRGRRYATANGFALDVQRFLAHEAISARPPSTLYKLQKVALRNKLLFIGVGVIALFLVVSLIVVSVFLARERQARREAETASAKSAQVTKFLEDMMNGVGPLNTLDKLADTFDSERKWSDAETVRREALVEYQKQVGTNDTLTLYALRRLGVTLEGEGKWAEAESIWRGSLDAWRKRGGIEERQSMFTLRKLGMALDAESKWPEAETEYRQALTISRKQGGNDGPEALADMEHLAGVLVAQKKFGDAQKLLDEALTPAFARTQTGLNLLLTWVDMMGRRGRWPEATTDAALLLQFEPTEQYNYHRLAGLLAMAHDRPAYEQLCRKIPAKFANPTNPYVAERMAEDCLLLPHSGVDPELIDKWADTAVTLGKGETSLPFFQACKAMSNYRLGRFPEAVEWGGKAAKSSMPYAQAKAYAALAMADWCLGQKDAAQTMLVKGDSLAPGQPSGTNADYIGESWVAWLFARVSLDEAAALVQPGTMTHSSPNQP
jgi:eukaryotic-like serine/threonine-protein kinase